MPARPVPGGAGPLRMLRAPEGRAALAAAQSTAAAARNYGSTGTASPHTSDNTTVGQPVPASVIRLLDVTRIALASNGPRRRVGGQHQIGRHGHHQHDRRYGDSGQPRRRSVLATQRILLPRSEMGGMTRADVGHACCERICERKRGAPAEHRWNSP